jgi:hypothetical protein
MHKPPDASITNHGTICLFHLHTRRARAWVDDHVAGDRQFLGDALAVEHRFVEDIDCGMHEAKLRLDSGN